MASSTPIPGSSIAPKYNPFSLTDIIYKHVNDTPIPATILVPNDLKPGKHPVTVRWHGGGFATGQRLFPDWYGDWTLSLYHKHHAIAISPDYRLMPEANGQDILSDVRDLFKWLLTPSNLAAHLPEGIEPDLDHILVTGESAGGWMALQSAFVEPEKIVAVISHYPMIAMRDPHYSQHYIKEVFEPPAPQVDFAVLDDYVAKLKGDEVVPSRDLPDGVPFVVSLVQRGLYPKYFGEATELYPLEVLDKVDKFPPVWIMHGYSDNVVPIEGSEKFAKKLEERVKDAKIYLSFREREQHGFDLHDARNQAPAQLDTDWIVPGVEFIEKFWPTV